MFSSGSQVLKEGGYPSHLIKYCDEPFCKNKMLTSFHFLHINTKHTSSGLVCLEIIRCTA